jgi:hypothetical protein
MWRLEQNNAVRRAFAFASSKATVRCELSPIASRAIGFHPDLAALAPYCELGEPLYCSGWTGMAPTGRRIDVESTMFQMVWEAAPTAAPYCGPSFKSRGHELLLDFRNS